VDDCLGTVPALENVCGTEWPFMCWCTVKKLLTHSRARKCTSCSWWLC